MKMLVAKMALATSVAFATLISAEAAFAQPHRQQAASEAYDDQANPNYGCRYLYSGGPKGSVTC